MKAKFSHWYNALAATLLTLLGFSSCGNHEDEDYPVLYGTPTSTFQVKGNVTDEAGNPIQGIQAKVELKYSGMANGNKPTFTDSKGNYVLEKGEMTGSPTSEKEGIVKVIFEDVDGEENGGTFANDTVMGKNLTINKVEKGDGAWNLGSFEITANAKLKKKQ